MGKGEYPDSPVVAVQVDPSRAGTALLLQLLAGLEEEGVPGRVQITEADLTADGQPAAVAMAYEAARSSSLEVGLAMDAGGALALHHLRAEPDKPIFVAPAGTVDGLVARAFGVNAARLVKVQPFRLTELDLGRHG